ncbi:MAG: hypothetical protein ACSHWQ_06260 [Spongiibacteraceae bacterium]
MILDWNVGVSERAPAGVQGEQADYVIHTSVCSACDDTTLRAAAGECVEKATSLLSENIDDDSMYVLFGWDAEQGNLMVSVSDAAKQKDASQVVCCNFSALDEKNNAEFIETLKYWITDYLTTCSGFMRYSLVAAFYSESRDQTALL